MDEVETQKLTVHRKVPIREYNISNVILLSKINNQPIGTSRSISYSRAWTLHCHDTVNSGKQAYSTPGWYPLNLNETFIENSP